MLETSGSLKIIKGEKMVVDTLADVLCRIGNGWCRKLRKISVPNTKFTQACLKLLSNKHCIGKIHTLSDRMLEVELTYDEEGRAPYSKFAKISKCSLRRYSDVKHLHSLVKRYPHYMFVVSTNEGVMLAQEAVAKHKGGELLFKAIQ